jgi:Icc-related predicted phosphoesterase
MVLHSPPKGHVDGPRSLGSSALLRAIERVQPRVAVCGHIHEAAGEESTIGATWVLNLGPRGTWIEV